MLAAKINAQNHLADNTKRALATDKERRQVDAAVAVAYTRDTIIASLIALVDCTDFISVIFQNCFYTAVNIAL